MYGEHLFGSDQALRNSFDCESCDKLAKNRVQISWKCLTACWRILEFLSQATESHYAILPRVRWILRLKSYERVAYVSFVSLTIGRNKAGKHKAWYLRFNRLEFSRKNMLSFLLFSGFDIDDVLLYRILTGWPWAHVWHAVQRISTQRQKWKLVTCTR